MSQTPNDRPGLLKSVPWWGWILLVTPLLIALLIVRAIPPVPLPPVDYFALANAARGPECPPEENFFAGLLQLLPPDSKGIPPRLHASLMTALQVPPPPKRTPRFNLELPKDNGDLTSQELLDRYSHFQTVPWSVEDDPVLAAYVAKNDAALDALHAVARRPGSWRPQTKDSDLLIECLPGDLAIIGSIVRLYRLRIGLQRKAGNAQKAGQDLMTIYHMARHYGQGTMPIEILNAYAIDANGNESAAVWMMRSNVTAEQRAAFMAEFRSLKPMRTIADSIHHGERYVGLQVVAAMASSGSLRDRAKNYMFHAGGNDYTKLLVSLNASKFSIFSTFDGKAAIDQLNAHYDRLVDIAKRPQLAERTYAKAEADRKTEEALRKFSGGGPINWSSYVFKSCKERGVFVGLVASILLTPVLTQSILAQERYHARHDLLAIAIAAADYRDRNGRWPASTADLPPEVAALKDPFSGDAYILHETEGNLEIYHVGPDGKDHNDQSDPDRKKSKDDGIITLRSTPQPALPVPGSDDE